jgi:hypothetical protein
MWNIKCTIVHMFKSAVHPIIIPKFVFTTWTNDVFTFRFRFYVCMCK